MSLDPAPLAKMAAEAMDYLEEAYGEEAEFLSAVLVIEVAHEEEDDEEGTRSTTVHVERTEPSYTVAYGLLHRATLALENR